MISFRNIFGSKLILTGSQICLFCGYFSPIWKSCVEWRLMLALSVCALVNLYEILLINIYCQHCEYASDICQYGEYTSFLIVHFYVSVYSNKWNLWVNCWGFFFLLMMFPVIQIMSQCLKQVYHGVKCTKI